MPISACQTRHRTVQASGLNVLVREAGEPTGPAVLLLHGVPTSSHSFRNLMPLLADTARTVAPDMPGFGFSDAPPLDRYEYSFENIADTIDALTDVLGLQRMLLYVHDYGAAVAYHLATRRPERVLGLIVQNGSAHDEGMGNIWDTAKAYWADPSPENRAKLPDWHKNYVARFPEIARYHREHQPPCLILWGRYDIYYELDEIMAYARELDRLEMHVFDGGHLLLETHYRECALTRFEASSQMRRDELRGDVSQSPL